MDLNTKETKSKLDSTFEIDPINTAPIIANFYVKNVIPQYIKG